MPELPEVETVRRGLQDRTTGRQILDLQTFHPRVTSPSSLAPLTSIKGATIQSVHRRGKYLWFDLDRPEALVAHLGMTGLFLVHPTPSPQAKHLRARLTLSSKKSKRANLDLDFIDPRTFGWLAISQNSGAAPLLVSRVAKDIFDPLLDRDFVINYYRTHTAQIKTLLLNQSIMSGVGNIYADESLWLAQIHPETSASKLPKRKLNLLLDSISAIMLNSIKEGGTTFDGMYKNVNGRSGAFENSLAVYGREHLPCPRCRTPIRRIPFSGRSSHFCPNCQRL